jgi:putative lipoprotein (rSAM/lipoprotein system)
MKTITIIKRRLLKKVLNLLGVCSAALMTTCAKYGVAVSMVNMNLSGIVRSKDSAKAIEGIQVTARNGYSNLKTLTDNNGVFSVNTDIAGADNIIDLNFSDIDGVVNGSFVSKDTLLTFSSDEILLQSKNNINIRLEKNE